MSLLKSISKSLGNVVSRPVHAVSSLAKGDVKQAYKDLKNIATGGVLEVAKRELGISTDQMLGLEAIVAAGAAAGGLGAAGAAGGVGAAGAAGGVGAAGAAGSGGVGGLLSTIFGSGSGNFLSDVLGSVVRGAVGIGADYFSNQQYYKDQKRLNEQKFGYDRQLADEAYQRDVAMWNMQNAYNAPSQQMERLKQAGLNPNLVYGSGSVTGNTAGSAPSAPVVQYPSSKANKLDLARNVLGIFNEYQSIKNQALDNQRENARIVLQSQALQSQNDRYEKQYQLALANLGLRREQFEYMRTHPQTWLGKGVQDVKNIGSDLLDWLGVGNGVSPELF